MKLSVVIVNYNVEYFLEQCIHSVLAASKGLDVEVFMVDNDSVDGSVQMVKERFPSVKVIDNKENLGFSKANNQAMRLAKGEYILLLNPDTVIEEDTLRKCLDFMDAHPEAGGLGVKMVDGKGIILPESKRGLPTPETAFYKITGLNKIFPSSKRINRYYLGHLPMDETHEIEILSGAFMFMRKTVLDKVGLLDEAFFMYGEDIDLSYRIILGGYKNYYLPETSIIHYKGESTKKGSLNYVFVFYNAMIIFAKKHFSTRNASIFSKLIQVAIWLRASWSVMVNFLKKIFLPLVDLGVLSGLFFLALQWYGSWKHIIYDQDLTNKALPLLSLVYVFSTYVNKGYRKPWKKISFLRAVILGFTLALAFYSILPDTIRFSRAIILISPLMVGLYFTISRGILNLLSKSRFPFQVDKSTRFGIIGDQQEFERVKDLISQTGNIESDYIHFDTAEDKEKTQKIDELINVFNLNEIVFCAANLTSSEIIRLMSVSTNKFVDYKIAPPESLYIIGSNSVDKKGDLFILDVNSISKEENRKKKRTFDLIISTLLIVLFPITFILSRSINGVLGNLWKVMSGQKTLVGYGTSQTQNSDLPVLKPSVISVTKGSTHPEVQRKMNVLYARDYKWRNDLLILFRNLNALGV